MSLTRQETAVDSDHRSGRVTQVCKLGRADGNKTSLQVSGIAKPLAILLVERRLKADCKAVNSVSKDVPSVFPIGDLGQSGLAAHSGFI